MKKRTKIVCTLGPASETPEKIDAMITAGMNVVRLNFSHGTYENHQMLIDRVRDIAKAHREPVAILQDLQGPKIRVGVMPKEGAPLEEGQDIVFDTSKTEWDGQVVPVDYTELSQFVRPGERLLLNDGRIETKIVSVQGTQIRTKVVVSGSLTSHKGINVPDTTLKIRALTDKDKQDLRFGVEHSVDFVAVSFVTKPEDIIDVRYLIQQYEKELGIKSPHPIRIIAKIERREALDRIDAILDVVDGIMIARGDLGVEIPAQEVPLAQKKLIDKALSAAKPVIVATQMLDSMQSNPRPTRAEVSDVANAVIDHADAVMLSNETATGKYPVLVVKTMAEIVRATEKSVYDDVDMPDYTNSSVEGSVTELSRNLAEQVGAKLILAASLSGETGRLLSRVRPPSAPILVATNSERVQRQLNFSWGVKPFVLPTCKSIEELAKSAIDYIKKEKIA